VGDEGKNAVSGVLEVAGVVGFDGASVGGQVKANQAGSLVDYNVGAQLEKSKFIATVLTESKGDVIRIAYYHKVTEVLNLGVELLSDEFDRLSKSSDPRRRVISIGDEYQLDVDTLVKAKVNNYGEVSAVVEHRLPNAGVVVAAAAQFKAEGIRLNPDKFGLAVTWGE